MGSNGSKQTKGKKIHKSNLKKKPKHELPKRKERHNQLQDPYSQRHNQLQDPYSQRHNQLQDPYSQRPVELSWLQQNNRNDNYNQIDRHHHHHVHYDEHLRRTPIAINRWPKDNEQSKEQKPKSFIEEYVRQ